MKEEHVALIRFWLNGMVRSIVVMCRERELGPRFPPSNSFEFVFGQKWKELYEVERQRRAQLEEELKEARRRLDADMELAYQDYQTQMLREGKVYQLITYHYRHIRSECYWDHRRSLCWGCCMKLACWKDCTGSKWRFITCLLLKWRTSAGLLCSSWWSCNATSGSHCVVFIISMFRALLWLIRTDQKLRLMVIRCCIGWFCLVLNVHECRARFSAFAIMRLCCILTSEAISFWYPHRNMTGFQFLAFFKELFQLINCRLQKIFSTIIGYGNYANCKFDDCVDYGFFFLHLLISRIFMGFRRLHFLSALWWRNVLVCVSICLCCSSSSRVVRARIAKLVDEMCVSRVNFWDDS